VGFSVRSCNGILVIHRGVIASSAVARSSVARSNDSAVSTTVVSSSRHTGYHVIFSPLDSPVMGPTVGSSFMVRRAI
jgi:hypothetical protein